MKATTAQSLNKRQIKIIERLVNSMASRKELWPRQSACVLTLPEGALVVYERKQSAGIISRIFALFDGPDRDPVHLAEALVPIDETNMDYFTGFRHDDYFLVYSPQKSRAYLTLEHPRGAASICQRFARTLRQGWQLPN